MGICFSVGMCACPCRPRLVPLHQAFMRTAHQQCACPGPGQSMFEEMADLSALMCTDNWPEHIDRMPDSWDDPSQSSPARAAHASMCTPPPLRKGCRPFCTSCVQAMLSRARALSGESSHAFAFASSSSASTAPRCPAPACTSLFPTSDLVTMCVPNKEAGKQPFSPQSLPFRLPEALRQLAPAFFLISDSVFKSNKGRG